MVAVNTSNDFDSAKTQREKMLSGEYFHYPDFELARMHIYAQKLQKQFNDADAIENRKRRSILTTLLRSIGENSWIEPSFYCDYGIHIEIGNNVFVNMNCTFLDGNRIAIGDGVYISPNVQLLTTTHPTSPSNRSAQVDGQLKCVLRALPISIENNVWIGAGAIVLPGVTIGMNSVIGAGSIVTKSIPANMIAAGNPCRLIKKVEL